MADKRTHSQRIAGIDVPKAVAAIKKDLETDDTLSPGLRASIELLLMTSHRKD